MQNESESVKQTETETRKLQKPAREEQEMAREELVTYADEAGGSGVT